MSETQQESLPKQFSDLAYEAGLDEAGRGCLAGPVVAAAVILSPDFSHPLLKDSKQLRPEQRDEMRELIKEHALAWAIGEVQSDRIDEINILQASIEAMHIAVSKLSIQPQLLAVDGRQFNPYPDIPHECLVKGDSRFQHIAAASILAKTYRDALMQELHELHPQYGWDSNKGYPTPFHRKALAAYGSSPFHRKSFKWKIAD